MTSAPQNMARYALLLVGFLATAALSLADVKISDLPAASAVADADLVPIVQGGTTKKATATLLRQILATDVTDSTTVGRALLKLTNPSAVRYIQINADNTITVLSAASLLSAIGAQASDADLTTYAGITPSANVQSLLGAADYSAMRTQLSLVIGTNVQAYDADLTTYAGITPSANVQSFLGAADYSAMRTQLSLVIGTNVQAYDADLTTYAGITPSANVQSFLGAADYAAMRTQLGLVIGTNVQAYDADLTTYAGITPSANVQSLLGAASYSAMRTQLTLVPGTDVQAYDADLSALAALSGTDNIYYRSAANTWTSVTIGSGLAFSSGTLSASGAGLGDFSSNTSSSVDSEAVIFSGTGGKTGKRFAGTGIVRGASGVLSAAELSGEVVTSGSNAAVIADSVAVSSWNLTTPIITTSVDIGSAGVRMSDDGDGALTFLGLGNGSDEDLTWNFDDVANTVTVSSSTGVNSIVWSGIDMTIPTVNATTVTGAGGGLTLDASGFNGNLATTDNTLQEIAQKLDDISTGGATNWTDIADASGDTTIAFGAHETDFTSTIDASGEAVWTITNTDADAANDNSLIDLKHNDGADANVFYLRMIGDADGTPTNDFLFSQAGATFTLPLSLGTSGVFTTGTIELGAASDTTLSRASAGVLAVEGTNVLLNGGALGTPSSGTLTNATGLPVAGITSSTSTALGVGSLEIGAASDTTLARVSAGVASIEGSTILVSGGALGTPSSGTLTNATGLPVAGITSSTSTALGVGSLELGAASDTTLARVSAGVVSIEGVNIVTTNSTDTLTNKTLTAPKFADLGFIADANGNELIILDTVASAVNEWTLANGSTGVNPKLTASGETNVGLDFQVKGTGVFRLLSTASGPTDLRLFEDTDNGSNYVSIIAPASTADVVMTLPAATDTFVGKATTDTFTNKTLDGSGTGNVLKFKSFPQFTSPLRAEGTNATIGTTVTAVGYGLVTYSNSTDEASNWAEWRILVPADWDTAVDPRVKVVDLIGADTGARQYTFSVASVASSASGTTAPGTAIDVNMAADGSGASGDVEVSSTTTLTGWGAAVTPGQMMIIRCARDGDQATQDASTVNSTLIAFELEYGATQ